MMGWLLFRRLCFASCKAGSDHRPIMGRPTMPKAQGVLIASALLALTAAPAFAQGSWTMKQPLSEARNEVGLAAVNGKVYVIGGTIAGNAVPPVDEYDPATDQWRSR